MRNFLRIGDVRWEVYKCGRAGALAISIEFMRDVYNELEKA